jgi:hypothetical protein
MGLFLFVVQNGGKWKIMVLLLLIITILDSYNSSFISGLFTASCRD